MNPSDGNDDDEPLVRRAKRAGRVLGWLFVAYLVFSLGRMARLW